MKKPPLEKIAIEKATNLAEVVSMINQTFALARQARDDGDVGMLRRALEQRRHCERRAGQLLLAGVPNKFRCLSRYQDERFRAIARLSAKEFDAATARYLRDNVPASLVPTVRIVRSSWVRDEHGNLSRTLQAF